MFKQSLVRATRRSLHATPLKSSMFGKTILYSAAGLGLGAATLYFFNARSAIHEYVLCPIIRLCTPDAEIGHRVGILCFKYGLSPRLFFDKDDERLKVNLPWGSLKNPVGCAAGLDKDGEGIDGILATGFSYLEIGSITPLPQDGNPKPRFFRLPQDDAVINRYGFNSSGHDSVFDRISSRVQKYLNAYSGCKDNFAFSEGKMLAVNLGKNKTGDEVKDYVKGVEKFGSVADVLVINVSSPNTPGLRTLQAEDKLYDLLHAVVSTRNALPEVNALKKQYKPPVLVKVAPDLSESEIESIANAAKKAKIDGIIVSNTTIQRPEYLKSENKYEVGGLSGAPVKPFALQALKTMYKHTKDSDLILVGCGGIASGKDALEFGRAGATFVELYTSFAYKGPGLVAKIKDEINEELKKEGKTWMQIVGEDAK